MQNKNMEIELENLTQYATGVNVYNDGQKTYYAADDKKFEEICVSWNGMICGAHQMPAFGVSLNAETVKAMKSGVWAEFIFGKVYTSNEMPFEKLLVNAVPNHTGFNIIRYTSNKGYDGRCFYYDLVGKDMSGFYTVLTQ